MKAPRIPPRTLAILKPLAEAARREGLPLYAVGGCVRDWLLGRKDVPDLDLVAEGDPAGIAGAAARLLGGKAEAFGAFGTLRVKGEALRADFAAARREEYPEPAALPKVSPAPLERDLFRRDFTINAMALRLEPEGAGELVDPYGGLRDLEAGTLRVLHPASFRDDPTRVFRAARFLCRLGLKPAPGLRAMARESLLRGIAAKLSRHRVAQEFLRILAEDRPEPPLRLLRSWGYLDLVHPRLPVRVRGKSAEERIFSLALALGKKGESFLGSLPVEHAMARRVREALSLCRQKASPRTVLEPEVRSLAALAFPRLPAAALKPLFLKGADLHAAGLTPGPSFSAVLDEAARSQWSGRIASRAQAMKWLSRATC
ncbi:MAG: CCA tRNA nucleotidyltransferase [Elusimicrobia bacterium]|nr:CCA tRNA nucleotidyltransferase [Elusimicrobiota bacterium]